MHARLLQISIWTTYVKIDEVHVSLQKNLFYSHYDFLAHWIRISDILSWDRKSYRSFYKHENEVFNGEKEKDDIICVKVG